MQRLLIYYILSALVILTQETTGQPIEGSVEYTIVRQDEKITLYERWTDFPGTTMKARDIKIVFTVATTTENLLSIMTDATRAKEWQKNLSEYKFIPQTDTTWHTYSLYEIPWPLTNQDYFALYVISERSNTKIIIDFQPAENPTLAPAKEGADRMKAYGKWVLEKGNSGKTEVTYTVTGSPVNYPRIITDKIVRNNFMSTVNKLILVAER